MSASSRRISLSLSWLFAAAPFVVALIRFKSAGDLRMLWMALASTAGIAVLYALRRRSAVLALVVTTLIAAGVAYLLGATAAAGIWPVALAFGISWMASVALYERANARVQ